MKKSCSYCGKVHDRKYVCDKKPKKIYAGKYTKEADIFRSSYDWKQKRENIKQRDRYLCQACLHNLYGTIRRLTTENLSVHHIRPLKDNYDLRLNDSNLITLCTVHHELADSGEIGAEELLKLIPPRVEG